MRDDYGAWLKIQGYSENSCNSRQSNGRTVERAYAETLDEIHSRGGLRDLVGQLVYSSEDERRRRTNPSRVEIQGNVRTGLATLKGAVMLYAKFLGAPWIEADGEVSNPPGAEKGQAMGGGEADPFGPENQRLSLERDMQQFLRGEIASLEPGLTILDDGAERAVLSGFIDILARDVNGATVVIELKAGKTDARVIGQVLGYMGDIAEEDEPQSLQGIIVAHEFDQRTKSAARAVPNLRLVRYAVSFTFQAEV